MRVMIFNDKDNFDKCLKAINRNRLNQRFWRIEKYHHFLFNKINSFVNWRAEQSKLVRSYIYTGEYKSKILDDFKRYNRNEIKRIDEIIKREEFLLEEIKRSEDINEGLKIKVEYHVRNIKEIFQKEKESLIFHIEKQSRNSEGQKKVFEIIGKTPFLELKTTDLRHGSGRIYQKGVDVRLVTDLINFAHCDAYDVALILSGDSDLIQAIKLVRESLGKIIIIVSYFNEEPTSSLISPKLIKEADYFINLRDLDETEINQISESMKYQEDKVLF